MNDYKFEKFTKSLKDASLTKEERDLLRREFMARTGLSFSSVRPTATEPAKTGPSSKDWNTGSILFFKSYKTITFVSIAVVFIVCSGAVVYASKYALPGDLLYPFKIEVGEPIVRAFYSVSPTAKADYELQLVEERFVEAEELNNQNPLTGDQKTELKTNLMGQTAKAENAIKAIGTSTISTDISATSTMGTKDSPMLNRLVNIFQEHQKMYQVLSPNDATTSSAKFVTKPDAGNSAKSGSENGRKGKGIGTPKAGQ